MPQSNFDEIVEKDENYYIFLEVLNKLKKHNFNIIEIEDIKIDDTIIINDVVKKLEEEQNRPI